MTMNTLKLSESLTDAVGVAAFGVFAINQTWQTSLVTAVALVVAAVGKLAKSHSQAQRALKEAHEVSEKDRKDMKETVRQGLELATKVHQLEQKLAKAESLVFRAR